MLHSIANFPQQPVNTQVFTAELPNGVEESMHRHGHVVNDGALFFITDKPNLYPELQFRELEYNPLAYTGDNNGETCEIKDFMDILG